MYKDDFKKIIKILFNSSSFISAQKISQKLNLSSKTIRIRISEINSRLKNKGVRIISKPRMGFFLEVENEDVLINLLNEDNENEYYDTEYKMNYLFDYMFNSECYVKSDDLAEILEVSKPTLSGFFKKLEEKLKFYDLKLERRPNYGMKIVGSEFDIRNALAQNFIQKRLSSKAESYFQDIINSLLEIFNSLEINISNIDFEGIAVYIYVSVQRIKIGKLLDSFKNYKVKKNAINVALSITKKIENICKFDENEIKAIAIHISSKSSLLCIFKGNSKQAKSAQNFSNLIVTEELKNISGAMINLVYDKLKIDFRNNFNLIVNLDRHIVPLDIRIRYNISIENPMLEDIKNNYSLAYIVAKEASIVLKNYYAKDISDEEIAYLAVIFQIAFEENGDESYKYNLLIVSDFGRTTSELLARKYKKEFADYIENIYISDLASLDKVNFSKIDYIFSTVNLNINVPVPIIKTSLFFEKKDCDNLRQTLKTYSYSFIDKYFKKELFCANLKAKNKEEVLTKVCNLLNEAIDKKIFEDENTLPKNFLQAVIERENIMPTDFGCLCALPHPIKSITKNTFAFVAILQNPILWHKNLTQIIFLVSISSNKKENLHNFYESISNFVSKESYSKNLIKDRSFENLKRLLKDF